MAGVSNDAGGDSAEPDCAKPKHEKPGAALSFEESLARLERIARDLEEGDLGLDAALARYQEGVACLRECRRILERSERKIELLMGVTESGEAITAPFDDGPIDATTLAAQLSAPEMGVSRSKRRSAPKPRRQATSDLDDTPSVPEPGADPKVVTEVAPEVDLEVDVDSPKRLF